MQPTNLFFSFLVELVKRLKTSKPKFFVYLQYFTMGLGAITGIPSFLLQFGITLPPAVSVLENKYVAWASVGFLIASQLTTQSTINSISPQGPVNKQTNPKNLPFTAAVEVKEAVKEGKPTEIAPETPKT
jgi:hypothetical protein